MNQRILTLTVLATMRTDDDGDGTDVDDIFPLNGSESIDTDGDGIGNNADTDDDGDGVEDSSDAFCDINEWLDTDGDGIGDNADTEMMAMERLTRLVTRSQVIFRVPG